MAKGIPLMGRGPDGKAKMINVDENGNVKVQQSGQDEALEVTLTGRLVAKTTPVVLTGDASKLPDAPLSGRRTLTVSHNGRGGAVFIGGPDVSAINGLRITANSPPYTIYADDTSEVYGIADPFEYRSPVVTQRAVFLPLEGLVIGIVGNRIYGSYDVGKTWDVFHTFPVEAIHHVTVVPHRTSDAGYRLVAFGSDDNQMSIYLSTDSGNSWTEVHQRAGTSGGLVSYDCAASDDGVVIGTSLGNSSLDRGFYRSDDHGNTWSFERWADFAPWWSVEFVGQSTFVAGTWYAMSDQVWRSIDGGVTWDAIWTENVRRINRISWLGDGNALFVVTRDNVMSYYFMAENLTAPDENDIVWNQVLSFSDGVSQWDSVDIVRSSDRLFVATPRYVRVSDDSGLTWSDMGLSGVRSLLNVGAGDLMVSTDDGTFVVYDGFRIPVTVLEGL